MFIFSSITLVQQLPIYVLLLVLRLNLNVYRLCCLQSFILLLLTLLHPGPIAQMFGMKKFYSHLVTGMGSKKSRNRSRIKSKIFFKFHLFWTTYLFSYSATFVRSSICIFQRIDSNLCHSFQVSRSDLIYFAGVLNHKICFTEKIYLWGIF